MLPDVVEGGGEVGADTESVLTVGATVVTASVTSSASWKVSPRATAGRTVHCTLLLSISIRF